MHFGKAELFEVFLYDKVGKCIYERGLNKGVVDLRVLEKKYIEKKKSNCLKKLFYFFIENMVCLPKCILASLTV